MSITEALSGLFSPSMASAIPTDWWAIKLTSKKGAVIAAQAVLDHFAGGLVQSWIL